MEKHLKILPIALSLFLLTLLASCQTPGQPVSDEQPGGQAEHRAGIVELDEIRIENIRVGQLKITGVEHLKPFLRFGKKGWNVYYEFHVLDDGGHTTGHFISFGSYDPTNDVARSFGSLPAGQRIYHLDLYEVNRGTGQMINHTLIKMQRSETCPTYKTIRDEVIGYLSE